MLAVRTRFDTARSSTPLFIAQAHCRITQLQICDDSIVPTLGCSGARSLSLARFVLLAPTKRDSSSMRIVQTQRRMTPRQKGRWRRSEMINMTKRIAAKKLGMIADGQVGRKKSSSASQPIALEKHAALVR